MTVRFEETIAQIRAMGAEAFIDAWVDWRNYTLIPVEQRAGKILSSQSMEVLKQVLSLIASADESLDDAQPLLADLMGVPNPDADEESVESEDDGSRSEAPVEQRGESREPAPSLVIPVPRYDEFEFELRALSGRR